MTAFCPRCGAELREQLVGAWFDAPVTCDACALTLADPPLLLAPAADEEEVEYSLDGWPVAGRAATTDALAEVDIPYRWEAGLVLVVPAVAEEEVDQLLEDLAALAEADEGDGGDGRDGSDGSDAGEDDDVEDDEGDGGEEAQTAMAELFVAADRLQHDPADPGLGAETAELAATVGATPPPYGIERPVWRRIQRLAATVAAGLEEGSDDDEVAAAARSLRDFLRDLV